MAEENENIVEEVSNDTSEQLQEKTNDQPRDENGQFVSKFDSAGDDSVIKVDLSKPPPIQASEEVEQQPAEEKEDVVSEEPGVEEVVQEIKEEPIVEVKEDDATVETTQETPVIQDVTEEQVEEVIEEAIAESEATGKPLPENIQKLMQFMDETGGDLNDYVNLNRDVSKMDDSDILDEYYRATKPHLSAEERNFLLEEKYGVDEDVDDERSSRLKKIALKEQVAEARAHLDRQKSKYYEDIKAGSKLTQEQQNAIDFFNRYSEESKKQEEINKQSKDVFVKKTNDLFNDKFKGFDFNIGEKKFRFNVKNVNDVKSAQSDLNNLVGKFIDKDGNTMIDAKGYHKSIFSAMNADAIASHFYEQGKADATKERIAKDKNINMEPRKMHGETNTGGVKYRVLGENTSDMKNRSFKIRKKN